MNEKNFKIYLFSMVDQKKSMKNVYWSKYNEMTVNKNGRNLYTYLLIIYFCSWDVRLGHAGHQETQNIKRHEELVRSSSGMEGSWWRAPFYSQPWRISTGGNVKYKLLGTYCYYPISYISNLLVDICFCFY
jgi:hypothetical protein